MSVFLFRVKSSAFERAQAKDGQHLALHLKPDPLLDSCSPGDIAIICTEINKSAPACFALSAVTRDSPLHFSATILNYDPSRKDSHLLRFPNGLEQHKNLGSHAHTKVFNMKEEEVAANVLNNKESEGSEVKVEKTQYSFRIETHRCNLLQDGELVIESDSEDTQAYRKIEDDQYVAAIQSLINQKANPEPTSAPSSAPPSPGQVAPAPTPTPSQPSETPQPQPTPTQAPQPQSPQPPQQTTPPKTSQTTPSPSPNATPRTTHTPQTPQTPTQPATSPSPQTTPPPPPPPQKKSHKKQVTPSQPRAANGHTFTPQGEKREHESPSGDTRDPKKTKVTPTAPTDITPVDLLMHVTSVAGMLKELDAEHSDRLSKLEEEVAKLKNKFNTLPSTPTQESPSITKESPPSGVMAKKRGRPPTKSADEQHSPEISSPPPPLTVALTPVQKPTDPLHFAPGEFIAVRVDPASSSDGYWMARVIPGAPKQGLVRVKWFEKYAPLPGWYFMDTREDLVDPLSIFHRNFELIVKPWKNRSGHFIEIYRPMADLSAFDGEK